MIARHSEMVESKSPSAIVGAPSFGWPSYFGFFFTRQKGAARPVV